MPSTLAHSVGLCSSPAVPALLAECDLTTPPVSFPRQDCLASRGALVAAGALWNEGEADLPFGWRCAGRTGFTGFAGLDEELL